MDLFFLNLDHHAKLVRPRHLFPEVKRIVLLIAPRFDFSRIKAVYQDIVRLFNGTYPGYRKCSTGYHDLSHTEDCLLQMVRLMHGARINGIPFSERAITLGIVAALMHDSGYIQTKKDKRGTGAKYSLLHIERSIDFMKGYFARRNYPEDDFHFCEACLQCTGLNVRIDKIHFQSLENEIMGKILGTADLLGQMANLNYLEKLPALYQEFKEGQVPGYRDEFELLQKTPDFWEFTKTRLAKDLGDMRRFLRDHFRVRWGIDRDLVSEAVEIHIFYLKYIIENHPDDYRRYLRRAMMFRILRKEKGDSPATVQ
ncbi:MAG: hypothetical protein QME75_13750 [Deltaproteobacteria bacterium]|nr:hypothetical protein [Deltaproteobacteria bacterium]